MKLVFHVHYKTTSVEYLHISLWLKEEDQWKQKQLALHSDDKAHWSGSLHLELKTPTQITYYYEVLEGQKVLRQEWNGVPRIAFLAPQRSEYHFYDFWKDLPEKSWLYSSALAPQRAIKPHPEYSATILLRAYIPGLKPGQKPFICTSSTERPWDTTQAQPLFPVGVEEWGVCLNAAKITLPLQYKFILKDKQEAIQWEQGENRFLYGPLPKAGETYVYGGLYPRFHTHPVRQAGLVLPVFSIRTEQDWGAGDFGSLHKLIDWAAETGQKMIQLLPVNDTSLTGTWRDSYPYNSLSVYALHPLYTDMTGLPALDSVSERQFQEHRQWLNQLPVIDYEAVLHLKLQRLRLAFQQEGKNIFRSEAFQQFWKDNSAWLAPYAMFCALKDQFGSADWQHWPKYSEFSEQNLFTFFALDNQSRQQAYFYLYVQFLLHKQLLQAHAYAHKRGISLKGDIPIGVSPYSVEAWKEPHLFHLDMQAGAPPDDFSQTGQNWGFPTYNWDEMAKDGYTWWKRRFTHMARYFDAYRIDHVLGFFRIWEIPAHAVQGLLGQFSPALALSEQEITSYGINFHPGLLQASASESFLQELFGNETMHLKETYLTPLANGRFGLRERVATQRKIQQIFAKAKKPNEIKLRNGLYTLCSNVLFVTDHRNPTRYHPRISALQTEVFRNLPPAQQAAFKVLYNDYFYRRQDDFWKQEALRKLPPLTQATSMLCCAEDLGMIPHCVPEVMERLQMLSLEIERMPKRFGEIFADTTKYPYLSVATPSTHDMSVLRGWWHENKEMSARFWKEVLGRNGEAPADLPADACEQIVRLHLQSPSMLCLIGFQDWTSIDDTLRAPDPDAQRINVPANPQHYWRYRMHISVEELLSHAVFNQKIKHLIQSAAR